MLTGEKSDAPTHSATPAESLAFPASVAQQAFWYLEMLDKNVSAFNVPLRYRIDGPLDHGVLERAIRNIAIRHEILRTHFEEEGGELLQVVLPDPVFLLGLHDIGRLPEEERETEADRLGSIEANHSFNLSTGPLFRAELVRFSAERHHLHLTFHHAIFDGLSIGNFIHELCRSYEAFTAGKPDPLPPLPIQYGDFSVWQKDFLSSPEVSKQLVWWKEKLAGMVEPELPADRPRPSRKSWKGDIITVPFPADLTEKLLAIANRNSATLFHIQLAAFKLLLHRYTGATDISVGTPVSGRTQAEIEPLVGVFINSLILRSDLSGDPTFEELLGRVRDTALQAIEHQDLPFENLVRALKPERDPGRNPLFQINFSHDRFSPKPIHFGTLRIGPISSRSPGSIFDLHLFMSERDGAWKAGCDFSTDLFDRATIERILGHFLQLLGKIVENPAGKISGLDILTDSESSRILTEWSGVSSGYPREETVGGLFTTIAGKHADRTALIRGGRKTTYRQLHADATAIAAELISSGVKAGDLVAIPAGPSERLIAALLGILLAGAVYVPLHPADPRERTKLLLEECGAKFLLAEKDGQIEFAGTTVAFPPWGSSAPVEISAYGHSAGAPAYLMFTSGSTGKPKGVLVPHRAITRLVKNTNYLSITTDDVFLHAAPATFDASTLEIWGPLLNGASLVIPEGDTSLEKIATAVREHGVTTLWLTAGLFNLMIEEHPDALKGLRHLLAGGDVLSAPHVRKALAALPGTTLINGYGPTENTTFTTCHRITLEDLERPSIPIGRPVSNTTVFLLDAAGKPVPTGVPGELHTGGDGLAIGYHQDAALTAEKFIDHPRFGRLYRTGDRCRWTPDGTLEFIGRTDYQAKVRGFRIEPGEIESVLVSHPGIRQAKVAVRGGDSETKRILAWVQPITGSAPSTAEIAGYLAQRLPAFMCPDAIGIVDSFPINANGKIDTRALPDPQGQVPQTTRAAPVGKTEQRLAFLWSELLGVEEVSRDDEFFSLGGHSLMALRMFSRINREFDRSLPLSALISHPTVRELAALLEPEATSPVSEKPGKGNLVALSPDGTDAPLICIHGGDGGILFYRDLAALLPADLPVHAIESMELSSSGPIGPMSIEETAGAYIRTLTASHPEGPFRLAGYSFGGVVAYEMACQLVEKGHRVEFLGLLDTHNPSTPYLAHSFPRRISTFWKNQRNTPLVPRLFKLAARFAEGVATNRRVKKEERAAKSDGPAEAHGDLRRVQVRQENWRAMQAYKPRPFPGKITLFKAEDQSDKFEWPEDYGWRDLGLDGFSITAVSGKHLTLFEPENVHHLARALSPSIPRKRG